jgi:hypothetical protein
MIIFVKENLRSRGKDTHWNSFPFHGVEQRFG